MKSLSIISICLFLFITGTSNLQAQDSLLYYLAMGDGYTAGTHVAENQGWPAKFVEALQKSGIDIADPQILAQNGWTTSDLQKALHQTHLRPSYAIVSLLIGVNDQKENIGLDKYSQQFRHLLIKAIRLAGGYSDHVFVLSLPDYSVTPAAQKKNSAKIKQMLALYDSTNHAIAKSFGVHYINITPLTEKMKNNPNLIANDGLHPSGNEYELWVKKKIIPVMLPIINTWPRVGVSY